MTYHTDHPEPLLIHDRVWSSIAVYSDERLRLPTIGVAFPKGWTAIGTLKARVYELRLKGREGPEEGLYVVRGGRFERVPGDAEVFR